MIRPVMPSHARLPRWFPLALLLLGASAWLTLSLWNDFPYFYHTDEPGKVKQIAEGTRNLHHPLLLLESVALAVKARGIYANQNIVETGRAISAAFAAAAVVLLSWTVARARGPWTGLAAGLLLLTQPDLHEYSRYFKEDAALLFGVTAVFAAIQLWEQKPGPLTALLLGTATALALSAKYIGAIMLLPAAWILIPSSRGRSWPRTALAILALVSVAALINLRLLTDPDTFRDSLSRETTLVLEGQAGVTKSIPHAGFFARLLNRSAHLLPLCILGTLAAWRASKPGHRSEWFLIASPIALAILLSFSAKDSGRYFLPACAGIAASAATGLAALASSPRWHRLAIPATLAALALSFTRTLPYLNGFRSDARRNLLTWAAANLPPESQLIQGRKVCLPDFSGQFADGWHHTPTHLFPIDSTSYLPDFAPTPAALAAAGYSHAAIAGDEFERYLRSDQKPKSGRESEFSLRRNFYLALESEATLLWSSPPGKVGTHQPELRLYQLPTSPTPQSPPATPNPNH
jgi:hypothetical protein